MALKTKAQLETERAAAGAAWLTAVDTLRAAYIELSAYDQAVTSGAVNNDQALPSLTFNAPLELPQHKLYVAALWPNQSDKIRTRAQIVITA